jgi:hypothetical protein
LAEQIQPGTLGVPDYSGRGGEVSAYSQNVVAGPLDLVVQAINDCERRYHDVMVQRIERRYDAYRGLTDQLPRGDQPQDEDWHSNVTTPYVLQTCEGMIATMLEPNPRFNVQPRPKPDESLDMVMQRVHSVEAVDDVLRYALDRAHFAEKQRDFMQQDLICGITVLKDYWRSERRDATSLVSSTIVVTDEAGNPIDSIDTHVEQTVNDALIEDDADFEVRDVRDFFWPPQCSRIENAEYLIDRVYESWDSLKRKEKAGLYKNVDEVKYANVAPTNKGIVTQRELRLRNVDRTQNLVEVLEYWTPERVITVANRTTVLADRKNPFWNGRMPFVVCSAMPDAFQVAGISVVEALAQLQEMLWTLQNQRLDVVRMLANLITVIRSDVDDPDAFEWAPNAQWFVEDPGQVDTLKIDPTVASITLQAETLLKGDLQNIMGGLPMNSGVNSQTVDQTTATGVSIITTIAQRMIQARKQHYLWAWSHLAKDFLLLYQQFLRDDRVVKIIGPQSAVAYKTVTPLSIQGDYDVTIDITSDSLMRQERRAEANSLLQIAAQTAPVFAQSGAPLNLKAFMEKTLDAYDVTDKERYFLPPQQTPQMGQPGAGQPGPPGMPGPGGPPGPPGPAAPSGMTNVDAAAGPLSPNGGTASMSPALAMANLMRQQGGANNAGGQ